MRAPVSRPDTVIISDIGLATPKVYELAPVKENVSYITVPLQSEAQLNQPLVWPLTFHGGIGYTEYKPGEAGIDYTEGMLTHEPNIIRPKVARTTVTLTGAANPPQYFFESTVNDSGADDGKPVLYIISPESGEVNVYKISLDSGDFGTLLNTKTFTVTTTQPMGRPAEWNDGSNTEWYLGLGDNGKINRLSSIVSGTSADTWSAGTDTADARHLIVVGNRLMRSTDENRVSLLPRAGDPTDDSAWGGDFYVGDVSRNVTELGEAGGLAYIGKTNGFAEWDTVGQAVNIFPEIGIGARNGQGMLYWHGGFLIPASNLWWTRTGKPVGPDSNPNNRANNLVGLAHGFKHGRWFSLAAKAEYVFGIYISSAGSKALIAWGRERDRLDPPGWGPLIWHVIDSVTADLDDFHGIFVAETGEFGATDIRPSLWFADGNNVAYVWLDKDGSPQSRRGNIDLPASSSVYAGRFNYDLPLVTKQWQLIEGWAEDMAASGHKFSFIAYMEGDTAQTLTNITSNGFFQAFWVPGATATGRILSLGVTWTGTDNLTSTNGPHLRDLRVRSVAMPGITREWTFLFNVKDDMAKTAKKLEDELEVNIGSLLSWERPGGDSFRGVLAGTRLLRADEIQERRGKQPPPRYVIAGTVREVATS